MRTRTRQYEDTLELDKILGSTPESRAAVVEAWNGWVKRHPEYEALLALDLLSPEHRTHFKDQEKAAAVAASQAAPASPRAPHPPQSQSQPSSPDADVPPDGARALLAGDLVLKEALASDGTVKEDTVKAPSEEPVDALSEKDRVISALTAELSTVKTLLGKSEDEKRALVARTVAKAKELATKVKEASAKAKEAETNAKEAETVREELKVLKRKVMEDDVSRKRLKAQEKEAMKDALDKHAGMQNYFMWELQDFICNALVKQEKYLKRKLGA